MTLGGFGLIRGMLVALGALAVGCGEIGEEALRSLVEAHKSPPDPKDPARAALVGDRRVPLIPDDVQFIDFFVPHHDMAVKMANVEIARGARPEIKRMAEMMKAMQLDEIKELRAIRKELTGKADSPMPPPDWHAVFDESAMLSAEGADVDRMFLEHMIPHHASGLPVAHRALDRVRNEDLRVLAEKIADAQAKEIGEMKAALGKSCPATGGPKDCQNAAGDTSIVGDRRIAYTPADDVKFIDFFVPHHREAVAMADLVLAKGRDERVKEMARMMREAQAKEIADMQAARRMLTGVAESPPPPPPDPHNEADMKEMERLSGRLLDHHFVMEMIPHHASGLHVAHQGRPRLQLESLRMMAHEIFEAQAKEIGELHALLEDLE